jgi:isopentenyl-diphosphate delta-isomerase
MLILEKKMVIFGGSKMNEIILVNDLDEIMGSEEKIKVHREGILHRAFSILVFNSKNELLLQKRTKTKYHSGGLWSNTCCGHQNKGETLEISAKRRLKEEMNLDCELEEIFSFRYYTSFNDGLIENEIDHVFTGYSNSNPILNQEEAEDYKWISLRDLEKDILENSNKYTSWFKIIFNKYLQKIKVLQREKSFTITKRIAKHGSQAVIIIPALLQQELCAGKIVQANIEVLE